MKLLICNVGSTSLKYQLFDMDNGEQVLASGGAERVGTEKSEFYWKNLVNGTEGRESNHFPTHKEAISRMLEALLDGVLAKLEDLGCVGFKVVHAKGVSGVQYLTEDVLEAMAAFNTVAPAHNPPYIAAIRQFRELLPHTPLIGSFETAFHQTLPPKAYLYSARPWNICPPGRRRSWAVPTASLSAATWAAAAPSVPWKTGKAWTPIWALACNAA